MTRRQYQCLILLIIKSYAYTAHWNVDLYGRRTKNLTLKESPRHTCLQEKLECWIAFRYLYIRVYSAIQFLHCCIWPRLVQVCMLSNLKFYVKIYGFFYTISNLYVRHHQKYCREYLKNKHRDLSKCMLDLVTWIPFTIIPITRWHQQYLIWPCCSSPPSSTGWLAQTMISWPASGVHTHPGQYIHTEF